MFNGLKNNVQKLLEEDTWKAVPKDYFEIKTDLTELNQIANNLPLTFLERSITFFSRLNPYFYSGLFLYSKEKTQFNEVWIPCSAFKEGLYFPIPQVQETLQLPKLKINSIKKTSPFLFLNSLNLTPLCDLPDSSAFLIKISPHVAFVFFSNLPEPWSKIHVEKIFALIQRCFSNS